MVVRSRLAVASAGECDPSRVLAERRRAMAVAGDVREHPAARRMAGLCERGRSDGIRALAGPPAADRGRVSSRGLWRAVGANRRGSAFRARLSLGERRARLRTRQLRLHVLGSHSRRRAASRGERLGCARSRWQRMGVDVDDFRSAAGLRTHGVLSRILGRLLRRSALRDEGGLTGDGARSGAPQLPQLVPARTIHTSTRSSARRRARAS